MLTICLSAQLLWQRANTQNVIFLNLVNSIDNTKLSWYTLPPRQHHSFFRNLPPLFIYNYHNSTGIKKTQQQQQKPPYFTKADQMWPGLHVISGTKVITHTHNTSCKMPIVLVTFTNSSEKYMDLLAVNFTLESFDWS